MILPRVIVFAKAPVPGKVKTRLVPVLGERGAADLARTMLLNTLVEVRAAGLGRPEVCADPHPSDRDWEGLLGPGEFHLTFQGTGDLGERLARAAVRALAEGDAVILIGTDCPALDRHQLREIASRLNRSDAVIYPAHDGGYVALGLRRFDRSLFNNMPWSSASVAEQTIRRIEDLGWSLDIGKTFHDIDMPADLDAHGR